MAAHAEAAAQIEAAMQTIDRWMPSGRAKVAALHVLGLEAARLRREVAQRTCVQCHTPFTWSLAEQRYDLSASRLVPPDRCPACRVAEAPVTRICRRCGGSFPWTKGEQEFFAQHGYQPPRHCASCRTQKRRERTQAGWAAVGK